MVEVKRRPVRRFPAATLVAALVLAAAALLPSAGGAVAAPSAVQFEAPTATAVLDQPIVFRQRFESPTKPVRVELVARLPDAAAATVTEATVSTVSAGTYQASVTDTDFETPNTTFQYFFRVTLDGGIRAGPSASVTVEDARFDWQTLSGQALSLHWYGEDASIGRHWLDVGNQAIAKAAALFGVRDVTRVDFFVYNDSTAFQGAAGPGTNGDAGGTYMSWIRTAFAEISPGDVGSGWPEQVIAHELTHHVFELATKNPYHTPPDWLDEGLATYMSEGFAGSRFVQPLEQGIAAGTLIPLSGFSTGFPRSSTAFALAYAESDSAVDYFLRTYGSAAMSKLVTSYAAGVSDDQAFTAATGSGVDAFGAAWLASIGARTPVAYGPKPAPAGPLPSGWTGTAPGLVPASPAPGSSGGLRPGASSGPGSTGIAVVVPPSPGATQPAAGLAATDQGVSDLAALVALVALGVAAVALLVGLVAGRRGGEIGP